MEQVRVKHELNNSALFKSMNGTQCSLGHNEQV